jgi:hypothetical protein
MKKIYNWFKKKFRKINKLFIKENPKEFKNNNRWGDAINIDKADNYYYIKGHGFIPALIFLQFPEKGDLFVVNMSSGQTAVYVFTEIKRMRDPSDMFFFKAEFYRYKEIV